MREFPYEEVYKHFAEPIVKNGLPEETMNPMMWIVNTDWKKITDLELAPEEQTAKYFRDYGGKTALGKVIRLSVSEIGTNPYCIVLISEAYQKMVNKPSEEQLPQVRKGSLENDPEAEEVVMISIYRPEGTRMGVLPIAADRTVKFAPLYENSVHGRLTTHPVKK